MTVDHSIELPVAGQCEAQPDTEAAQQRLPGPETAETSHRAPHAVEVVGVLVGLQGDVVAEPLGLLMGVGVATHVREERGVVDDRPLVVLETQVISETQRDPTLAQHVLHGLAEPEVDTERQRTDELGEANPLDLGRLVHTKEG